MPISTEWYQKSSALKALFKVLQQAIRIGYESSEVFLKRNQQMTGTQDLLHKFSQNKFMKKLLFPVSRFFLNRAYVFEKPKCLQKVQSVKMVLSKRRMMT